MTQKYLTFNYGVTRVPLPVKLKLLGYRDGKPVKDPTYFGWDIAYVQIEGGENKSWENPNVWAGRREGVTILTLHPNPGFGCGVMQIASGYTTMLALPKEIFTKEFAEEFRRILTGTTVSCVTDTQIRKMKDLGMYQWLEKEFILHHVGKFPNYTHGPENMNVLAFNTNPGTKSRYPVTYAFNYKEEVERLAKEKQNAPAQSPKQQLVLDIETAMPNIPVRVGGNARAGQRPPVARPAPYRDAHGRFAKRPEQGRIAGAILPPNRAGVRRYR